MQAMSAEQYARLGRLAEAWTRRYLKDAKGEAHFNPRLGVDALCFQPHLLPDGRRGLLGALVTPVSLSLALVVDDEAAPPLAEPRLTLALPSGRYPFAWEPLSDSSADSHDERRVDGDAEGKGALEGCWRCELLEDISDLDSRQAASRLAQQLMERVMTPSAPDA
ncbi:[NiFe]-hydrogenase assembly chaperone HybE [Halomonas saccharevitans]|uniref:[NiFe]-hydrogenase assembly chaperone HybE n=1 Tax=Halomonas saccharevitans TaxID=416872 RepID=A0ABU3NA98_9GAMM|nr:[NiFe]-hydrogenase assembly chaperone HybE [Halomonas saccharevitans]MDT8878110.1 [NiFe]-hydrogenase assembly chaperone HybE [Halomonas saccharevitans]